MGKLDDLFGREQRLAPTPTKSADQSGGIPRRSVQCDVCHQTVPAMLSKDGYIVPATVGDDPANHQVDFVGSCGQCDVDICAKCAAWVMDPSIGSNPLIRRPACKKCSNLLCSKTYADKRRLREGLIQIQQGSSDVNLMRRMIRLMHEEEPILAAGVGLEAHQNMVRSLMDLLAESEKK